MIDNKLYLEKGKGEPIILLHGLFGALSNWKTVVNQFAKTHRVIIPKIPLTEVDVKKANLESLTDYVKKFINKQVAYISSSFTQKILNLNISIKNHINITLVYFPIKNVGNE